MNDPVIKQTALLIATLASFLTPFTVSSINIALPAIGGEFHMSAVLMGWVPTSYSMAAAMFLLPFGRLADILGRKRVFTWGMGVFTFSSFLLALSPSSSILLALRIVQGVGSAMIFGTGMAILTSVYPPGERGRVLGFNVAAVYIGLSVGPVLGGFLTHQYGWRSIFLVNVPLGLLVLYFVLTKLKREWAEAKGETFDIAGSLLYGAALAALMYGLSKLPTPRGAWFLLAGAAGGALFIIRETRTASPLLNMDLFFRNTAFAFSNLAALIHYSATFAVTFLMSLYLQYIKNFTPEQAGFVLISQPLVMAVFSPLAGRLSDKIEPRTVASLGMAFTSGGLLLFAFMENETPLAVIVAGLMLIGFGFALFSSPNTNAVMASIERRFYGVGSAALGTMRLTGQMMSMGISMLIFAVHIGGERITPDRYPLFLTSVKKAFIIFAVLCFSGIFASLARGKVR